MQQPQEQETISPRSVKVSQKLLKGLTPEEQQKFEGAYKRAKTVLNRQHEYFSKEVDKALMQLDNPTGFETPNWQYKVAWIGGYRTAMRIAQEMTRTK